MNTGLKRGLIAGAIASIVLNGAVFVWWASSSFSWGIPLPGVEFALFLAAAALFLALLGGLLTRFSHTRAGGLSLISGGFVFAFSFFVALRAGNAVRMLGFQRFAERATSVVAAIEEYSAEHGHPPTTLDQLVPEFLPAIPSTRVGSAPNFGYIAGDQALQHYDGNPWALELDVATGLINWDILVYYPLQNYPEYGHGGVLEPVADWAYVHE